MRHAKSNKHLSRPADQRLAMLRAIVRSLFLSGKVSVTVARAKEARRLAEKIIAVAKQNNLTARRQVESIMGERAITTWIFKNAPERFEGRAGGCTRLVRTGFRRGDAAPMAVLELL
ncbi:50S ribosomal protein L17 [Candidatus Saganbacteria bacterium]|nr:50S ribosomal protein L17 [Candidatus Saganbacteria bacterium]